MATSSRPPFRRVLVSTPGKVILFGEHAVVYGKPAIATSVDLRCYLLLVPTATATLSLRLPDMHLDKSWNVRDIAELLVSAEDERIEAIKKFCDANIEPTMQDLASIILLYLLLQIVKDGLRSMTGLDVLVSSELPFGAGLGSSAAYSVSLAAGLMASCGVIQTDPQFHDLENDSQLCDRLPAAILECVEELGLCNRVFRYPKLTDSALMKVNQLGLDAEKIVHGTPSGIDNSISTYGGAIFFKSGDFTPLSKMPNLSILLVYTKVARSTKKMVSTVRQRYASYPNVIGPIMDSIESVVMRGESVLEDLNDTSSTTTDRTKQEGPLEMYTSLQDLFSINHHLLNALGVGHTSLDKVLHIANDNGLVCKATGAGGGGCAIVMSQPDITEDRVCRTIEEMQSAGFDCWRTSIGSKGVTIHCCSI